MMKAVYVLLIVNFARCISTNKLMLGKIQIEIDIVLHSEEDL